MATIIAEALYLRGVVKGAEMKSEFMEGKFPRKLSFSFLPIPEELMKSKVLSFGAKFLFGIIAKANKESVKWSVNYLGKRMGCSPRETTRRIAELKENNLIVVIPRKGRVNEYLVNFELIHSVQTPDSLSPDQIVRGQSGQEGGDHNGQGSPDGGGHPNSKEYLLNNTYKEADIINSLKRLKELKRPVLEKITMPQL